jgi:hypothetical protein
MNRQIHVLNCEMDVPEPEISRVIRLIEPEGHFPEGF